MTDLLSYAELPAPAPAGQWVHCIWFLRGPTGGAPQAVVPDGRAEIIFHFGDPFYRASPEGLTRQAESLVSGQLTAPLHLVPGAWADIVGIRFRTAGARPVLGLPLNELTGSVAPLGEAASRLSRLREAAAPLRGLTDAQRAERIAAGIARLATGAPDRAVITAVGALNGAGSIGAAASAAGLGERTLERRVLAATGLSPVVLRRVMRFRKAFRLLGEAPVGRWAGVAHDTGYHDQAHMIRDFRAFAGASPSEFFGADPVLSRALLGEG